MCSSVGTDIWRFKSASESSWWESLKAKVAAMHWSEGFIWNINGFRLNGNLKLILSSLGKAWNNTKLRVVQIVVSLQDYSSFQTVPIWTTPEIISLFPFSPNYL